MNLVAQKGNNGNMQYWEGSIGTGPVIFMGDVKYNSVFPAHDEWRFAGKLSIGRRFSPLFAAKASLLAGGLAGRERDEKRHMSGHFYEINASGVVYLDNIIGEKRYDRLFQPYLVVGVGVIFYNTNLFYDHKPTPTSYLSTWTIKNKGTRMVGLILAGLGVDYKLNESCSLSLETALRGVNSDYLDWYKSGFPYDMYNVTTISFKYRIGNESSGVRRKKRHGYYPTEVTKRKLNKGF